MTRPFGTRLLAPFERLVGALADPKRGDRTAAALILGYLLVWWLYAVIAKGSQDIHFDMGEVVSWSLVPAYGYPKHPPFPAWVATVWFALLPYADWAYYLLSTVSIAVALWFVWLIAKRHVAGNKRALALAFLTFSPGFNFHPLKFNSNALLIPVWAAASYLFLRSFQTRSVGWGALAGLGAALAMLTKYWSIILILGFIVAALTHPERMKYLRSPAPWAAVVVGVALLAPNMMSLVGYEFQPFEYATTAHQVTFAALMKSFADYLGGALFLSGGVAAVAIACRPDTAAARDMVIAREADRRMLWVATATMFLAPFALALVTRTRLDTLWTMPMWAMLPAALLSSPRAQTTRRAAAAMLAAAVAFPLVALLLSPLIAPVIHRDGVANHAAHYRLIAGAVDRAWRQATPAPLRLFGSNTSVVNGAGFYLPGKPLRIDIAGPHNTPWADARRIAREGMAMVCAAVDADCMAALDARAVPVPSAVRAEITLARSHNGVPGAPMRYLIAILPPQL